MPARGVTAIDLPGAPYHQSLNFRLVGRAERGIAVAAEPQLWRVHRSRRRHAERGRPVFTGTWRPAAPASPVHQSARMDAISRMVVLGAAGRRDFHNFNVVYRDDPSVVVVAFTATQIPGIGHRRYPASLAGPRYPHGIPIEDESALEEICRRERVDGVVFAYSDVSHAHVMTLACRALAAGADAGGPRAADHGAPADHSRAVRLRGRRRAGPRRAGGPPGRPDMAATVRRRVPTRRASPAAYPIDFTTLSRGIHGAA
jgi:hypothetical protein